MLQKRIDDHASISRESLREAQEHFNGHLKRVGLKHTGQRDTILHTFLETREHLSTDELFRLVKKSDARSASLPSIARSSFYKSAALPAKLHSMTACALRAPAQPPQPPPYGLYGLRRERWNFLLRMRNASNRRSAEVPLRDHAPHVPDLRVVRGLQEEG